MATISSEEVTKIRKELDAEKLEHAQLNGRFLAKSEDFDKLKAKSEASDKELADLKAQLRQYESSAQSLDELERTKKEMIGLRAECMNLKRAADMGAGALEQLSMIQKEHELLVKELADIKATSFETERASLRKGEKSVGDKESKLKVIEEIREILGEVIYVYKTLETNAKEFSMIYSDKKEKVDGYRSAFTSFEQSKKKEEKIEILKSLAPTLGFLSAIPIKPENFKLLSQCMAETMKLKSAKLEVYGEQMLKFEKMINISKEKVALYEQKLSFYY